MSQAAAANYGGNATQAYNTAVPAIQQMMTNPGYTAAQQGNINASTLGALASRFGGAKSDVLNTATRTNNAASTNAALDTLAQQQGTEAAQSAANNATKFADAARSDRENAIKMMTGLYGTSAGQQTANIGNYINAVKTGGGVLNPVLNTIASLAGAGAKAYGASQGVGVNS